MLNFSKETWSSLSSLKCRWGKEYVDEPISIHWSMENTPFLLQLYFIYVPQPTTCVVCFCSWHFYWLCLKTTYLISMNNQLSMDIVESLIVIINESIEDRSEMTVEWWNSHNEIIKTNKLFKRFSFCQLLHYSVCTGI